MFAFFRDALCTLLGATSSHSRAAGKSNSTYFRVFWDADNIAYNETAMQAIADGLHPAKLQAIDIFASGRAARQLADSSGEDLRPPGALLKQAQGCRVQNVTH